MKTLISKYWLVLMVLVSVTLFTACSSDDDDAVTPVFPQVQTLLLFFTLHLYHTSNLTLYYSACSQGRALKDFIFAIYSE